MKVNHSRCSRRMTVARAKDQELRSDSTPLPVDPESGEAVSPAVLEHTDEEMGTEAVRDRSDALIATKVDVRKPGKRNGRKLEAMRSSSSGTEISTRGRKHLGSR